jgi:phage gpG-like protein
MPRQARRARFKNIDTRVAFFGGRMHISMLGKGVQQWLDRQNGFADAANDLEPFFESFGIYMLGSIDRNFIAEGRPGRWKPLAPSTIEERIRLGFGRGPILQRTRRLRQGFYSAAGRKSLRISNSTPYFKYHQQDTRRGKIIPRRIMVLMQNQDKTVMTKILRNHLEIYG